MNVSTRSPAVSLYADHTLITDGPSTRGNALNNRITHVLSSSYADNEIRDALRLYDARYKHKRADDKEIDLGHEAQEKAIEANAQIIDDFAKVAKNLSQVGGLIDQLNSTCTRIRKHVDAARTETAPMLEEAETLLHQRVENEQKQALLTAFTEHFIVSDDQLEVVQGAGPIDNRFFEILARLKRIHTDTELLLSSSNQRLGLELLDQTTLQLNTAYKKLFTWTVREFKTLDLEDPRQNSIRRALKALSERPALWEGCLEEFSKAREGILQEGFRKALSEGGTRAIEFSTHDPLRYLGDMLAWIHGAAVSEMEALEGLFVGEEDEISKGLQSARFATPEDEQEMAFDGRAALNELISRNMKSVAYTLSQRTSTTIRNLGDAVDIYKAYNLLTFYDDMFRKLIRFSSGWESTPEKSDKSNSLLSTLASLQTQAYDHFTITVQASFHNDIALSPDTNLKPPAALTDSLAALASIAQTRGPAITETEFARLYKAMLGPILESGHVLAEEIDETDALVYMLNYTTVTRDVLANLLGSKHNIDAAKEPLRSAQQEVQNLSGQLIQLLTEKFLTSSGVDELRKVLNDSNQMLSFKKRRKSLLKEGDDNQALLNVSAQRLDVFLASALMDSQESLERLVDRKVAANLLRDAVAAFTEMFERVVAELEGLDEGVEREELARRMGKHEEVDGEDEDEDAEENRLRDMYPRTVEEVKALLS